MNVPSGYTALDLIGFTDRGDYDAQENYVKNDLVHYNGRVWLCLVDDTTEITPVAGANWKVWIDEAAYLSGLADVTISNPANGEAIRYNSQSGKWENVSVDSTPTSGSANLVQSGGVATQLANKANTADLATVATTGAYSDLSGTPQLAAVATSGAYSDLTGQPTIPTVNDATLTIQKNGTNVETFTANSSTNKTANITVPDVINDLSDVNISSVANEEILAYDSTSSKWKNSGALGALKETLTNNGAHNLLPYTLDSLKSLNTDGIWSGNVYTISGVTFTVLTDDGGNVTGINVNGTATANTNLYIVAGFGAGLPACILSGCPTGGGSSSYRFIWDNNAIDTGSSGNVATPTSGNVRIQVISGASVENKIFYPMLRLASDPDDTFVPYAMTNRQLTDVAEQVIENYTYVNQINVVTITADGIKTIAELLAEVRNAAIDYQTNHPDEFIEYYLVCIDTAWLEASNVTFGVLRDSSYTGRLYFSGLGYGTVSGNDTFSMGHVRLGSNLSDCRYLRYYTYNNSIVDLGSDVLASGKTIKLTGKIYKKIK